MGCRARVGFDGFAGGLGWGGVAWHRERSMIGVRLVLLEGEWKGKREEKTKKIPCTEYPLPPKPFRFLSLELEAPVLLMLYLLLVLLLFLSVSLSVLV